jgi:hypothetical protein
LKGELDMPYENEHSARLENPNKFDPDSFRRKADGIIYGHIKVPSTIDVIWGKLKSANKPEDFPIPQVLRFPTKDWTADEAKKWLKDNDIKYIAFEPAEESKTSNADIEIRSYKAEIRADGEESKPKIKGTAAVFDKLSVDLGGFKEIIHQNSFGDIIYTSDVVALINHDPNLVLGRNQKSKTLFLEEKDTGLDFIIDPPGTSFANDLLVSMARGDMDKCSFAFVVSDEYWEKVDGEAIRHVTKFKELWDISIVTYPAFPQTSAQLFGRNIKTPDQVYREYRSMQNIKTVRANAGAINSADYKLKIYEKLSMKGK